MTAALPDISLSDMPAVALPLSWVGMQGIELPLAFLEGNICHQVHTRADVHVDLPAANVKGIHMSRLYRLLDEISDGRAVQPAMLQTLLQAMVSSHQDCHSRGARLALAFELLHRAPALVTEGLSGWRSSPVRIEASLQNGVTSLQVEVKAGYSSTCPCSAALARQLLEQQFLADFNGSAVISLSAAANWLRKHGSLATPHSQRSEATVRITIPADASGFGLLALIGQIEAAVATPLQTAVRRADEQAFAKLNGSNLMFVEDAARRLLAALQPHYNGVQVAVRHLESLHPHDAVAFGGQTSAEGVPA